MTDAELIDFVTDFREGILDGGSSHGKCAMVCWPLTTLLCMSGVPCESVDPDMEEMNHVWIRLADGRVLDPTADQFNEIYPEENFPPVYLGPPLHIHEDAK